MIIGFVVGTLQFGKAKRFHGLKRWLAAAVVAFTYLPALTILYVLFRQDFDMAGPGFVVVFSILLAIAFWTASLIWTGPAETEDKRVFQATVALMLVMMGTVLTFVVLFPAESM